eukprot:4620592-Pleurochrysis_carterae.AAC.1
MHVAQDQCQCWASHDAQREDARQSEYICRSIHRKGEVAEQQRRQLRTIVRSLLAAMRLCRPAHHARRLQAVHTQTTMITRCNARTASIEARNQQRSPAT